LPHGNPVDDPVGSDGAGYDPGSIRVRLDAPVIHRPRNHANDSGISNTPFGNELSMLARYLPVFDWGRRYDRTTLTSDLVAAAIVTVIPPLGVTIRKRRLASAIL
jgi:hypothetical protein